VLAEPAAEYFGGGRGERGYPLFAALSGAGDVGSGAQECVGPGEGGEFGDPQSGLDGERQQRVIAPPGARGGVRCGEQRGGFGLGEVGDGLAVGPFGRDGHDALDDGCVVEVAQCREAEQRVDRGQPGVAGADAVAAVVFEVVEERADQRRVEVGDLERGGLPAGLAGCEGQEQPERVAVGRDGVRAGSSLAGQVVGEERLDGGRERGHRVCSSWDAWSRPAARASSSGAADR
jgi:hypothetical protein